VTPPRNRKSGSGNPPPTVRAPEFYPDHHELPMNSYIRERLRADAAHLVARAEAEQTIVHKGMRGRFRELLVDALLTPWLPPYAGCGTGMIVDVFDRIRESTQEDIVVFDRSLVPPVLAHQTSPEGVFPVDGVLMRIEVKSTLTRAELRSSILAAAEIYDLRFSGTPSVSSFLPISTVFAFASDLKGEPSSELQRLLSVAEECGVYFKAQCHALPGPIASLCVVGRGAWTYGKLPSSPDSAWHQATVRREHDEILHFIGATSNTCFAVHATREGRTGYTDRGAGGGIGNFILSAETYELAPIQRPS
jgi:hypothetical protein